METFLNLLWLSVAVAATTRFAIRATREPDDIAFPQRRQLAGTALLCVIVLLFPIISVTDDLHEDAALIEESSGPRCVAASAQLRTHHVGHGPTTAVFAGGAMYSFTLASFLFVGVAAVVWYAGPTVTVAHPRGPPLDIS